MALNVKSGTLTIPSTTGNQSISGLGFQPKLVLFFANGYKYSDTDIIGPPPWSGDIISHFQHSGLMVGCGISSIDNKVQGFLSENNLDISNVYVTRNISKCIRIISPTPLTINAEASINSMDVDGFTLNWTTVDSIFLRDIHYIAFGGDTILDVKSGSSIVPLATGNQSISGLGFKPDLLIFFAFSATTSIESNSNSNVSGAIGFAANQSQSYIGYRIKNNVTTTLTKTKLVTDKCFAHLSDTDVFSQASLVSLDNDGFTVNWDTISGTSDYYYYVAISGGAYKTGSFLQPISTGIQEVLNIGFPTKGTILLSDNKTQSSLITDHARLSLSLNVSSADSRSTWFGDKNNLGVSTAYSNFDKYPSFKMITEGVATPNAFGRYLSNETNSFKINWEVVDSTQRNIIYLAFGDKVLTQSYNRFIFNGKNTAIKVKNIVFNGKQNTNKFNNFLFHGTIPAQNRYSFVLHGSEQSIKVKSFILHGKTSSFSFNKFVFNGLNQLTKISRFILHGKVLSENIKKFIIHGKNQTTNISSFWFNGLNQTVYKTNLLFEGNSDSTAGNFALFRVDLSGLPTTAQIINARLDLTVGFTSGSYKHELWNMDSTGVGWSDTAATWNHAKSGILWSQSLGAQYGGGYSNRKHKLSQIYTSSDEQRVSFGLNSTGIAYVQSKAQQTVEFLLLSDYTGFNYAYYRSVEDSTIEKRPEFFVDYIITSPSQSYYNRFVFCGKDTKTSVHKLIFNGKNLLTYNNRVVFHGLNQLTNLSKFIFHGKNSSNNVNKIVFHGSNTASQFFRFIFATNDSQENICRFIFNGKNLKENINSFVFNGFSQSSSFNRFIFSGRVPVFNIKTIVFNGIGQTTNSFRLCFDSGFISSQRKSFVFEGRTAFRFGYEIGDHNISNIRDRKNENMKDHVVEHFKDHDQFKIEDKKRKNIKYK